MGHMADGYGRRSRWVAFGAASLIGVAGLVVPALTSSATAAAALGTVAEWKMNEAPEAPTMVDSGPYGLDGSIGTTVVTGFANETAYRWPNISGATTTPRDPERIITVADDDALDPGAVDFAVDLRLRTTKGFGNIIQKGQNLTDGGYWKIEYNAQRITCYFKDGSGQDRAVTSPVDTVGGGIWHSIRCAHTTQGVELVVDGQAVADDRPIGNITNDFDLTIGGKLACNQGGVDCDYFDGDIDDIRIEKAGAPAPPTANQSPNPAFTAACDGRVCVFDSSNSSDPDGDIVRRRWRFDDGTTAEGLTVAHSFATSGTYAVGLEVEDDGGDVADVERVVTVGLDVISGPAERGGSGYATAVRENVPPGTVTGGATRRLRTVTM